MAEHAINVSFKQPIEVLNKDLTVTVRRNGKVFGTITISKGSIEWRPKRKWMGGDKETSLRWSQFDKVMRDANRKKEE